MTITLNRPDVLNAFNREMHAALAAALKEARDSEVRAVVLTGAGRGFCVGQDLGEFREVSSEIGDHLRRAYHPNVLAIRALEKPVIAAVNGPAAGAGMSFACACDVRLASSTATFVPGFVGIGLVPDAGGTWFIHRLLGFARAFEWMSTNRRLSADEAHLLSVGLVGMAQVTARYWLSTRDHIPREAAEQLVARLAWRGSAGISGWRTSCSTRAASASAWQETNVAGQTCSSGARTPTSWKAPSTPRGSRSGCARSSRRWMPSRRSSGPRRSRRRRVAARRRY